MINTNAKFSNSLQVQNEHREIQEKSLRVNLLADHVGRASRKNTNFTKQILPNKLKIERVQRFCLSAHQVLSTVSHLHIYVKFESDLNVLRQEGQILPDVVLNRK